VSSPIQEHTVGQPGWNAMVRRMLDRLNGLGSIIYNEIASRLEGGSGVSVTPDATSGKVRIGLSSGSSGLKHVRITQTAYNDLNPKDPDTIYYIVV
jgi:hypothetical protein